MILLLFCIIGLIISPFLLSIVIFMPKRNYMTPVIYYAKKMEKGLLKKGTDEA